MVKITAKGVLEGKEIGVVCTGENGSYEIKLSNCDEIHRTMVLESLREYHPVGGTYWPEKNTMLHVFNTLSDYTFDKLIEIDCDGELEEIPYEEGVVY